MYSFHDILKVLKLTIIYQSVLTVFTTLAPSGQNEFIDFWKATVHIVVLPIIDVKSGWNSTLEGLGQGDWSWEFTPEWPQNQKYNDYRPLVTTQNTGPIVKYIIEVLSQIWYWTLSMSKMHIVPLHSLITVHNDMCDYMDGIMPAWAKMRTEWKEDLYFAFKIMRQKLCEWYIEVTSTMGMDFISAHILDSFRMLWLFRMWPHGIEKNPPDETFYTTE